MSEGIVHKPIMPAYHPSGQVYHISRFCGQVLHKELFEVALAYEAYACGILLVSRCKIRLRRKAPEVALLHFSYGKHGPAQLTLIQPGKKIGLILPHIISAQKPRAPRRPVHTGIVSCSYGRGVKPHGKIQKRFELYLAVAQYVRVGGSSH